MFKNKIIQPLLFLVISIISYLIINKNNLFNNNISNINNKYDNILNIIFNSSKKVSNNIQDNDVDNSIFDTSQNNILNNIQNNNINDDIYNITTENFLDKFSNPLTKIGGEIENKIENTFKSGLKSFENVASTGLTKVGSEIVKEVIPIKHIGDILKLTNEEKAILNKYRDSPIREKKYRIAIDKNTKCGDLSLNSLTKANGATLYYNLMESCRGNDDNLLTNTPVCNSKCYNIDTVYNDSINKDIQGLKSLKTKLQDILEGKNTDLVNIINSQTDQDKDKEKNLGEIRELKKQISILNNTIKEIDVKDEELEQSNSTLQNKINIQSQQIQSLQTNNSSLQTGYDSLNKDYSNLTKDYEQAEPSYESYDKVLSFGNYTPENNLFIQGVTSEGGCVDNLPINTAKSICNDYANNCDGFYTYGYAPGENSSLRTCFKQKIDRNAKVIKNSKTTNNTFPNNATYLKTIPSSVP